MTNDGYKPEYDEKAFALAFAEWTNARIADYFGIDLIRFRQWERNHPSFDDALLNARELIDDYDHEVADGFDYRQVNRNKGVGGSDGFDYHVDPSASSNGAGTLASPYTCAQITALSGSVANKKIGLKAGTTGDGTILNPMIELSDNGVTIDKYGVGANPILDTGFQISGAWSSLGSNKWRWTGTQVSNSKASGNILKDGVPMALVQNTAGLTTAGQALVTAWGWNSTGISATTTFTVDIFSTVDPTSDGHVYRYSKYLYGIHLTGTGVTVQNVTSKLPLHQDGAVVCSGTGAHVWNNVRVEQGSRHNSLCGGSLASVGFFSYGGANAQENANPSGIEFFNTGGISALTVAMTSPTFDGAGLPSGAFTNTAIGAHDSGSGKLLSLTLTSPTFQGKTDGPSLCATTLTMTGVVCTSVRQLLPQDLATCTVNITGMTGSIDRLIKNSNGSGTVTLNTKKMTVTATLGDISDFVHAFVGAYNSGKINWNSGTNGDATQGDHITGAGASGDFDVLQYVANVTNSYSRYNATIDGVNWDKLDGLDAGIGTIAAANNNYPIVNFSASFSDYNMAAWKTLTGQEAGSVAA